MAKIDSRQILERVKERQKPERANFTFRFDKEVMEAFKKACEKREVTPTAVFEEFMSTFVADMKR